MQSKSKLRASECWPILLEATREGNLQLRRVMIHRYYEAIGASADQLDDPLVEDFYEMLCAYEFGLWKKNNKNTAAAYTRRALKAKGVYQFSIERVVRGSDSQGFETLSRAGLADFTVEALVVRYANRFPANIVKLAMQVLKKAN